MAGCMYLALELVKQGARVSDAAQLRSFDSRYYIFHYTYGIEYSQEGLPMELQVGEWSLDKRHYGGAYPPPNLDSPPEGATPAVAPMATAHGAALLDP